MILQSLALNFAILLGIILILWAISVRIRDVSFIDAFWGFGMVLLAWVSWANAGGSVRGNLLLVLTTIWGLRLSIHLFIRWRKEGEDRRYKMILGHAMEKRGWSWPVAALIMAWLMQMPLLFITSLPAQMGIIVSNGTTDIGMLAWIGGAVALTGIAFETIGDVQLKAFKANPNNKGKVLDSGLWRYTRHPNYFGDFTAWWGIWLVTADAGLTTALITVIGPLFLSFTLMKWSGGPMLERGLKKTRPEYEGYIERTSSFFPMPPKSRS
jgi:steroid 5-alpha reductase family enzyme